MDYILLISIAVFGAYVFTVRRSPPRELAVQVVVALLVAITFYVVMHLLYVGGSRPPFPK